MAFIGASDGCRLSFLQFVLSGCQATLQLVNLRAECLNFINESLNFA